MYGFRRLAYTLLSRHFWVGISVGFAIASILLVGNKISQAISLSEKSIIVNEQESFKNRSGDFFSDTTDENFTVNTYETICKGYYIKEKTGTEYNYIGFGPLADEYTYSIPLEKNNYVASTTKEDIGTVPTEIFIDAPLIEPDPIPSSDGYIVPDPNLPLDM